MWYCGDSEIMRCGHKLSHSILCMYKLKTGGHCTRWENQLYYSCHTSSDLQLSIWGMKTLVTRSCVVLPLFVKHSLRGHGGCFGLQVFNQRRYDMHMWPHMFCTEKLFCKVTDVLIECFSYTEFNGAFNHYGFVSIYTVIWRCHHVMNNLLWETTFRRRNN